MKTEKKTDNNIKNNNSLPGFLQQVKTINPDQDIYDFKIGNFIRTIYNALESYRQSIKSDKILIPYEMQKTGRGGNLSLKCKVKRGNKTEIKEFEKIMQINEIDVQKNKNNYEIKIDNKKK